MLAPKPARRYLDGTVGGGGHALEILRQSSPDGALLGLDWDDQAIDAAGRALARFGDRVMLRQRGFSEAREVLEEAGWPGVDGMLLDLGLSSHQLDTPERGFAFVSDARLDMRMDRRHPVDAHELVNHLPVGELEKIIRDFGDEPRARRIAWAIDAQRRKQVIDSTRQLAETVARAIGHSTRRPRKARTPVTHPATRTFQAVRIAVNRELENLRGFSSRPTSCCAPRAPGDHFVSLAGGPAGQRAFQQVEPRLCGRRACGVRVRLGTQGNGPHPASRSSLEDAGELHKGRSPRLRAVERDLTSRRLGHGRPVRKGPWFKSDEPTRATGVLDQQRVAEAGGSRRNDRCFPSS